MRRPRGWPTAWLETATSFSRGTSRGACAGWSIPRVGIATCAPTASCFDTPWSGGCGRAGLEPRVVDAEAVRRRLGKLDAIVRRLRPYGAMDARVFEADEVAQAACERLLQVAIQLVLDLGAHLLIGPGVLAW